MAIKNNLMVAALICLIAAIGFELGEAIYEGIVVASQRGAHSPESFAILQGEYLYQLSIFGYLFI